MVLAWRSAGTTVVFRILSFGLGVLLYREQKLVIAPALAAGAKPARWWLWWFIAFPVLLFAFLVLWQLLSPVSRQQP